MSIPLSSMLESSSSSASCAKFLRDRVTAPFLFERLGDAPVGGSRYGMLCELANGLEKFVVFPLLGIPFGRLERDMLVGRAGISLDRIICPVTALPVTSIVPLLRDSGS